MAKKVTENPDEVIKICIVLKLKRGQIKDVIDKVKKNKMFEYWWEQV